MTFILKLAKFRASTLMNICPYKGKIKERSKMAKMVHCLSSNSELIFDLKKLARNLDNDMNVITIETVKHYATTYIFSIL